MHVKLFPKHLTSIFFFKNAVSVKLISFFLSSPYKGKPGDTHRDDLAKVEKEVRGSSTSRGRQRLRALRGRRRRPAQGEGRGLDCSPPEPTTVVCAAQAPSVWGPSPQPSQLLWALLTHSGNVNLSRRGAHIPCTVSAPSSQHLPRCSLPLPWCPWEGPWGCPGSSMVMGSLGPGSLPSRRSPGPHA